ncbi:50S ribosome-binding GTPase [Candidatus Woesearchaeota archaeon]|nr:50S ribosome-binding GTPase [Candidatus Woesearchaeota archaeon]
MARFWKHVNGVLREAELIIEVLDARMIQESRNPEIEKKIRLLEKKILYVVTKCDLVDANTLKKSMRELKPSVFISSKDKLGTTILKKKIMELSHGETVTVGIVGYPNVGKSSLINALSGRSSARTSAESGFTKGIQKIKVGEKILVIDTPGVFAKEEKESMHLVKIGAVDYGRVRDPETAALRLIEEQKKAICKFYGIKNLDDAEDILEQIGLKLYLLVRKGQVNIEAAARIVLRDWQLGKIKEQ